MRRTAPLNIAFTIHSSPSNTFWQAVKKGFDDACDKVQANCQMIFTQTEGSIAEQQANMQTALAANPDALITSIVDNSAFDELIKGARDKGIIVIATNVDDTEGATGNARQAFIGQGFIPAGYTLAEAQSKNFPADGPIHVLVGVSAPGQNWSEQRAARRDQLHGGLQEGQSEPRGDGRADRFRHRSRRRRPIASAPISTPTRRRPPISTPATGMPASRACWPTAASQPGKVLLGGFDLVPEVLQQMKAGYVQVQIDQQPYEQGFMPVMEVYLAKKVGLAPADIDTGQGVVTPDQVDSIMELSRPRACAKLTPSACRRHRRHAIADATTRRGRAGSMRRLLKIYLEKPELAGARPARRAGDHLPGPLQRRSSSRRRICAACSASCRRSGSSRSASTILMICGEFDLSVGSVFALMPMSFAIMLNAGVPFCPAVLLGLAICAVGRLHQRLRDGASSPFRASSPRSACCSWRAR